MTNYEAPVPASPAQWPEARGFRRTYAGNPEFQARFVMALFGFRQDALERRDDPETVNAVETVIRAFRSQYPEFLQDGFEPDSDTRLGVYSLDDRLASFMTQLDTEPKT